MAETRIPRMVIAASGSGAGKTSIALGLVGALRRRGRVVQTFKVGPDFIDCAYLAHASQRPCRNLDSWMLGESAVRASFVHGVADADAAVVEGTMGVFDGHGSAAPTSGERRFPGSTAEIAATIGAPLLLVLDVGDRAETAAALALGVRTIAPNLDVVGVVLNNVGSDHRRRHVEDAVWEWATLPVLGALPRLPHVQIPEVRSGLLPAAQNPYIDVAIAELAAAVERHCDLDLLERLMTRIQPVSAAPAAPATTPRHPLRVGVAFDDAFSFYYAENLEHLEQAGATIVPFSPLEDQALPDVHALYLGGGLTEAAIPRLAANHAFQEALRRAHQHGVPLYAECGGSLYCARSVRLSDGSRHEMTGLIPIDLAMETGACHTGYRELRIAHDGLLGPAGTRLRGHEFHFSRVVSGDGSVKPAYHVRDADGDPLGADGVSTRDLFASLVHIHFGQDPALAVRLVSAAQAHLLGRRHTQGAAAV